jgi:predicted glutamine amidotransferase
MIAAIGRFDPSQVVDAAVSMSCGAKALHEYSSTSPSDATRGIRHYDGSGAVFLAEDNRLECVRSSLQIADDPETSKLRELQTSLMVIHVRSASVRTQTGISFVHPIERKLDNRQVYFFHNGYVPEAFQLLGRKRSRWDTEDLFEWLLPSLSDPLREGLQDRLSRLPPSTKAANFICAEGKSLMVCNWFPKTATAPRYYTMHSFESEHSSFFASETISEIAPIERWKPLGNGKIVERHLDQLTLQAGN